MAELTEKRISEEYFHLHQTVEKFDEKALTVKAWSITASLAMVSASFYEGIPILCVIAAVASALFWVIELNWKSFQQAYYARIKEIEEYMKEPTENFRAFQISASWYASWRVKRNFKEFTKVMFWPHVCLPHLPIVVGGIVIYCIDLYDPFFATL